MKWRICIRDSCAKWSSSMIGRSRLMRRSSKPCLIRSRTLRNSLLRLFVSWKRSRCSCLRICSKSTMLSYRRPRSRSRDCRNKMRRRIKRSGRWERRLKIKLGKTTMISMIRTANFSRAKSKMGLDSKQLWRLQWLSSQPKACSVIVRAKNLRKKRVS